MHDHIGDEFLDLGLAISVGPNVGVRKRKRGEDDEVGTQYRSFLDEAKVMELLHMRDTMMRVDSTRQGDMGDEKGLHLIHSLLISATAVDENQPILAADNLIELYKNVSFNGNSIQRVAGYFADGLTARLLCRSSPFYKMVMGAPASDEELSAFTQVYRASPYYQFAHFTANQAIIDAFEQEENSNSRSLHVIDFDVSYGFQWPSLIQSLSDKATDSKSIHLHITGFGNSLEEVEETEARLVNFAKGCSNLEFEFDGVVRGVKPISLRLKRNETIAVTMMLYLHTLGSDDQISDALKTLSGLNPSVVVLVEQEGSWNPRNFLSRFMESLHYFAAMFDSLDDCLPPDSAERLSIEKNHLGKEIKWMVNCDKAGKNYRLCERWETWKKRMEGVGFSGIKFTSKSVSQAKLLLKIRGHCSVAELSSGVGGFKIIERDNGKALSLSWQDRLLITASTWKPAR